MVDDERSSTSTTSASAPRSSPGVTSTAGGRQARRRNPELLTLTRAGRSGRAGLDDVEAVVQEFPDEVLARRAARFPLSYRLRPGHRAGRGHRSRATRDAGRASQNRVVTGPDELGWQVPGATRGADRRAAPLAAQIDCAATSPRRPPRRGPSCRASSPARSPCSMRWNASFDARPASPSRNEAWELDKAATAPAADLRGAGRQPTAVIAAGKDLAELRRRLSPQVRRGRFRDLLGRPRTQRADASGRPISSSRAPPAVSWPVGVVTGYPALVDDRRQRGRARARFRRRAGGEQHVGGHAAAADAQHVVAGQGRHRRGSAPAASSVLWRPTRTRTSVP